MCMAQSVGISMALGNLFRFSSSFLRFLSFLVAYLLAGRQQARNARNENQHRRGEMDNNMIKKKKKKKERNAIDIRELLAVAILATTPTRTDSLSSFSHFNLIKLEWQPFLKIAYLRDHNRYQMPIRAATTRRLYLAPPGIIGQRIRHLTNNRHQSALTRLE